MPRMATFPWSYGHHIASSERESPLVGSLNYIHWKFSPTADSSSSARIRYYPQTNDMSPTTAAANPHMHHMTTFPWRFGHDITSREIPPPLLYTTIVSLFVLPLYLRRWPTYGRHMPTAIDDNILVRREVGKIWSHLLNVGRVTCGWDLG